MSIVLPGVDEALVFIMHVDNTGPQSPTQAREALAATRLLYPNAQLTTSSLARYGRVLDKARSKGTLALPVISDREIGSTWIWGSSIEPPDPWPSACHSLAHSHTPPVRKASPSPRPLLCRSFTSLTTHVSLLHRTLFDANEAAPLPSRRAGARLGSRQVRGPRARPSRGGLLQHVAQGAGAHRGLQRRGLQWASLC